MNGFRGLRTRYLFKWGGLVLALLLLLAWLASRFYWCRYYGLAGPLGTSSTPSGLWEFHLRNGLLIGAHDDLFQPVGVVSGWQLVDAWPGFNWRPQFRTWASGWSLVLPIWIPFLLVTVSTGLLWWLDRRRRSIAGHCQQCGYDLTGNTSGICPECAGPVRTTKDSKGDETGRQEVLE